MMQSNKQESTIQACADLLTTGNQSPSRVLADDERLALETLVRRVARVWGRTSLSDVLAMCQDLSRTQRRLPEAATWRPATGGTWVG